MRTPCLRVAFKLLDSLPMLGLLRFLGCHPLVVFGESLPHEGASFQQAIPQPCAIKIQFSAHKHLSGNLDSFLG
jgi:hypothetical protein